VTVIASSRMIIGWFLHRKIDKVDREKIKHSAVLMYMKMIELLINQRGTVPEMVVLAAVSV
jgi:hypothetical protein